VGEARERRTRGLAPRERGVLSVSALAFLAAAVGVAAVVPNERAVDIVLVAGLVLGYSLIGRVRFEFGGLYGTPEQLLIVPMALLAPLPAVPLLVALATVIAVLPDFARHEWHPQRLVDGLADCWFSIPPVLVLAALAPGTPALAHVDVYALAFGAQLVGDFAWAFVRDRLLDRLPFTSHASNWFGSARVDMVLAPIAFTITLAAADAPAALISIGPLAWLFHSFAQDRQERYAKALELQRAYRGTVMLLSDVVQFEDDYTAEHSRSVVELVVAVADELGVDDADRQELEFAAMLHDVGKIAIPNEILNKPAKLTDEEFDLMKTHTIEAQLMLDRVGGLLARVGEIVRSCHERWDGNGYPDGLAGTQIPVASRIVFCCDAYHAMTSDRPYRKAMSSKDAYRELLANAGTQFDAAVVTALGQVLEKAKPVVAVGDGVRAVLAGAPGHPELVAGAAR
jgi:HD-GYP domain-containing protein (c-di-GMP phosphodiesterase class II)